MPKKTTLRGQFLRTVLLMLACSLLVGLAVIVAVMIAFVKKVPDGEQFLMDSVSFLFGKEVLGPNGMIHVVVLAAIALCLLVVLVCVLLASRYTSRVAAALREFRRAADDLRSGELDFQILTYPERELDELAQALESVRQRLKATAAAEAAAQEERGLLMANLSHDLRTPITAIKGYVEGIQDGIAATPEKQQHYLDIVYNKTMVMEKLVRNMSDFSEYELGRMQYHFEYVDMLPFLQDLAEEYQDDVQQSGMTFQAALPKGSYTECCDLRYDSFAATDITLNESIHTVSQLHLFQNMTHCLILVFCQRKRQFVLGFLDDSRCVFDSKRRYFCSFCLLYFQTVAERIQYIHGSAAS